MRPMGVGEEDDVVPDAGDVEVVGLGATTEVSVRGEVDIATIPALDAAVDAALQAGAEQVVIDLAGVTFIGSSGLAGLLRAQRILREGGARLELTNPSRAVTDLLEMTKLTERFGLHRRRPDEAPPAGP